MRPGWAWGVVALAYVVIVMAAILTAYLVSRARQGSGPRSGRDRLATRPGPGALGKTNGTRALQPKQRRRP